MTLALLCAAALVVAAIYGWRDGYQTGHRDGYRKALLEELDRELANEPPHFE